MKEDRLIFVKQYEIPSRNYNNGVRYLWWASGIKMELEHMMKQFDYKIFFYSYKDKYFFSNNEQKAREMMLKEVEKEQREGRLKRKNKDIR